MNDPTPLLSFISPQFDYFFDRSRLLSTDNMTPIALGLNYLRITSYTPLDFHIQILQSFLIQSVADFSNWDLSFIAVL